MGTESTKPAKHAAAMPNNASLLIGARVEASRLAAPNPADTAPTATAIARGKKKMNVPGSTASVRIEVASSGQPGRAKAEAVVLRNGGLSASHAFSFVSAVVGPD